MAVWTEWDKLESVLVGDCSDRAPIDNDQLHRIFYETKEDLQSLADFLSQECKVYRPEIKTKHSHMDPIVPRDQYLVYGNIIYSMFTSMNDRYNDSLNTYSTFIELFKENYSWISQPVPPLDMLSYKEKWWNKGDEIYNGRYKDLILLHAATIFKAGDRLIVNNQGPGTKLGLMWLRDNLPPDTRPMYTNRFGHIDQFWFMVNDTTIVSYTKDRVPSYLQHLNIIEIHEYVEIPDMGKILNEQAQLGKFHPLWIDRWFSQWKGYSQDVCFDTNVLVLDHNKILLTNPNPKLQLFLESKGIETYSVSMRHGLFWEAGVHCLTLDLKREGEPRNILC